jgi:hypothetical protein
VRLDGSTQFQEVLDVDELLLLASLRTGSFVVVHFLDLLDFLKTEGLGV